VLNAAGDLHANGGTGGNAVPSGSNGNGGGGGGGGGVFIVAYASKALAAGGTPTFSGAVNCAGGAGGTGAGTGGTAGNTGASGQVIELLLQ
jgi:hypothetical protein